MGCCLYLLIVLGKGFGELRMLLQKSTINYTLRLLHKKTIK